LVSYSVSFDEKVQQPECNARSWWKIVRNDENIKNQNL